MKPKTWTHPKFALLQRQLGVGPALAAGILEGLWHLAATFDGVNGTLPYSGEELAAWLGVDVDPERLVAVLVGGRWVDDRGGMLAVHDWDDHKPNYIREAERKRRQRAVNVPGLSRDCPGTIQDNPCAAHHSVSVSDSDLQEEVTNVTSTTPTQVWGGDAWPLSTGSVYKLPIDLLAKYKATYSWDVEPELKKCAQWCRENKPKRSKNAKGMQARITKWLNRHDDQIRAAPGRNGDSLPVDEYNAMREKRLAATRKLIDSGRKQ